MVRDIHQNTPECGPDLLALWGDAHAPHGSVVVESRLFVTSALPGCGKTTILTIWND